MLNFAVPQQKRLPANRWHASSGNSNPQRRRNDEIERGYSLEDYDLRPVALEEVRKVIQEEVLPVCTKQTYRASQLETITRRLEVSPRFRFLDLRKLLSEAKEEFVLIRYEKDKSDDPFAPDVLTCHVCTLKVN